MNFQDTRFHGRMIKDNGRKYNNVAVDPKTLMLRECMLISSAMRKLARSYQGGMASLLTGTDFFIEDDSIGAMKSFTGSANPGIGKQFTSTDNPLLANFIQLRTILIELDDIFSVDCLTLLQPFLLVIKSSNTSGHITSMALNSVSKFLSYGVISWKSKNLQGSLNQLISALTHCRFEAADQSSDDAVLLKVLKLLEYLIESDFSNLMPNDVVSEIVSTCLSLACNKKRSEVLRKAAEMSMIQITERIFRQLEFIEPEKIHLDDLQNNFSSTRLPDDVIGGTELNESGALEEEISQLRVSDESSEASQYEKTEPKQIEEAFSTIDVESVSKTNSEDSTSKSNAYDTEEESFDIKCINEFLGILISIISPTNQYQHMESTRVFALSLINTAVEVSGNEFSKHNSLMNLISDPIPKHVLQTIAATESQPLLQAALNLVTSMFIIFGNKLRTQFELSFTLLFNSVIPKGISKSQKAGSENQSAARSARSKEMIIEYISLLWTRSPSFFTDLFIHYDCNFDSSDLSRDIITYLCTLSLPEAALSTTDHLPPICFEGILKFIECVNNRIKSLNTHIDFSEVSGNFYLENKMKKRAFINCTNTLNEHPKQGIEELSKFGFLNNTQDLDEIAHFFFQKSSRLNKKILGEYLAKPKNKELLKMFINLFDFSDLRVDEALRVLLKAFRLPGEAQQIERIVETFADRFVICQNSKSNIDEDEAEEADDAVTLDRDCVFVLSYSIILLNTDLHSPQVKNQMDLEAYKRNLRGIHNGKDLPESYLSKIYSSIKEREIIMPEEHHGTDKWFDDAWHNSVTSNGTFIKDEVEEKPVFNTEQLCQFDKVLFESSVDEIIECLVNVFKEAVEDHIVTRIMSTIDKCTNICLYYNLTNSVDKLIKILTELSTLRSSSFGSNNDMDEIHDEIPITQIKLKGKKESFVVSELSVWFGRDFKAQISTVVLFRLIKKANYLVSESWNDVLQIVLKLYENCLVNPNFFSSIQAEYKLPAINKAKPKYMINGLSSFKDGGIFSTFSSFLKGYSDSPPEPTELEIESTQSTIDCIKSLNISGIFENILNTGEKNINVFVVLLLKNFPELNETTKRYFESESLLLSEAATFLTLKTKDKSLLKSVSDKLKTLLTTGISKKASIRIITYLTLIIIENDALIDSEMNTIFEQFSSIDKEILITSGQYVVPLLKRLSSTENIQNMAQKSSSFWVLLKKFASNFTIAFDIFEILKILNTEYSGIDNDCAIFGILGVLDEISSLGALGARIEQKSQNGTGKDQNTEDVAFVTKVVKLSKSSVEFTSTLCERLIKKTDLKKEIRISLIQAIAHQCFNPCREIRSIALVHLQNYILSLNLESDLISYEIFKYGLFPLMNELSKPEVLQTDISGFNKTHTEVFSLLGKVFLKLHGNLSTSERDSVWLEVLDQVINFNELGSEFFESKNIIKESGVEILKNMILVLQNSNVLIKDNDELWNNSWAKISKVYPKLKDELLS